VNELLIVDIYGDGEVLRVFPDAPAVRLAIKDWSELDRRYCEFGDSVTEWEPFDAYLEHRGFKAFEAETIKL